MKPLSGRGSRQWVMGLTVAAALAVVGLLFGLTQTARAAATSLDGSAKSVSSNIDVHNHVEQRCSDPGVLSTGDGCTSGRGELRTFECPLDTRGRWSTFF